MKLYVLNEEQLKQLIIQSNSFLALQQGGVDNWSFYSDSFDEAYTQWAEDIGIDNVNNKSFKELEELIAKEDLKEYSIIDWRLP